MADLQYGADKLYYGQDILRWGSVDAPFTTPSTAIRHYTLLAIEKDATTALWTGPGKLIHDGRTWLSRPGLIRLSPFESNKGVVDANRIQVTLALPNAVWDTQVSPYGVTDPGHVHVTVRAVVSTDVGMTWQYLNNIHFAGRISGPTIAGVDEGLGRGYSFELATLNSDANRKYTEYWDSDSQQRRFPNADPKDLFFEHTQAIELGAQLNQWPIQLPDAVTTVPPREDPADKETMEHRIPMGRDDYEAPPSAYDEYLLELERQGRGGEGGQ